MDISLDYYLSEVSLAVLMTKNLNFNNQGWEFEMKNFHWKYVEAIFQKSIISSQSKNQRKKAKYSFILKLLWYSEKSLISL